MAEHTPRPWETNRVCDGQQAYWTVSAPFLSRMGVVVDSLNCDHLLTEDEQAANACLIAAAPDLLAACEAMLAGLDPYEQELGQHPACIQARAAIAKAKGGS